MLAFFSVCSVQEIQAQTNKGYYMLKVYHLKNSAQQQLTESYLKEFYVPKLHKLNIKNVGVFKTLDQDTTNKRIYVLIPFDNWKKIENLDANVSDETTQAGRDYINADFKNPPYTRMETIILNAFATRTSPSVPKLTAPKADRVYELRSYESATEQYHRNKVKMFNSGETDLFDRIGSNPVFYGSVIAGAKMPNLMYMTAYDSMKERDKHWEVFSAAPEWKVLIAKDEYKNNVTKNDITFLHPTDYSDF
ncbi:NIPSNAP family protein [Mucilaginibacter sp. ZB1P21]|uniref:NIPSNAP family protein n=2 Tax=Mucilaginibacter glaciei TaxID=2772109 RepID=A0A926S0U8_9SPHI|nr:NIPSNAP family protein [Mucilaginibacter glaciei]